MIDKRWLAGLVLLAAVFCFCPAPLLAEPEAPLRIAVLDNVPTLETVIAQERGFFRRRGVNVEVVRIQNSNLAGEALARGEVDIAEGLSIFVLLALEARSPGHFRLLMAAEEKQGLGFVRLLTREDSPVRTLADLEGKKIAVFPGATSALFLRRFLTKNGVNVEKVSLMQMLPPQMIASMVSGAVDAVETYEPAGLLLAEKVRVRELGRDIPSAEINPLIMAAVAVNSTTLKNRPKQVSAALKALADARDFISSHRDETSQVLASRLRLPQKVARQCPVLTYYLPWEIPAAHLKGERKLIELLVQNKLLPRPVSFEQLLVGRDIW